MLQQLVQQHQPLANPLNPADFQAVYQAAFQTALLMQQQQQMANNMSMMMQASQQLGSLNLLTTAGDNGAAHLAASQLAAMSLNGSFTAPPHNGHNPNNHLAGLAPLPPHWPSSGMNSNSLDLSMMAPQGGEWRGLPSFQHTNGPHDRKGMKGKAMMSGGGLGVDDAPYRLQALEEAVGQVFIVAQDQAGCRFLQRKFDEGGPEAVSIVFPEILEHVVNLMTDPFGNYLIQKVLEKCSDQQRTDILSHVVEEDKLVYSSLNMHGTRAMQKLVETISTQEQRDIIVKALTEEDKIIQLIKDLNGERSTSSPSLSLPHFIASHLI